MNPRIGQVCNLIFLLITAAVVIASIFFPLQVVTVSNSVCTWYQYRDQAIWSTTCPDACDGSQTAVPACYNNYFAGNRTTRCEDTISDWRDWCKTSRLECQRQSWVFFGVWVTQIAVCGLLGIVLLLFILSMFCMGASWAIGILGVTSFFALAGVGAYAIGDPLAARDDYYAQYGISSGDCNQNVSLTEPWQAVGCNGFTGTLTTTCENTDFTWGPGLGWILYTIGLGLCIFTFITMILTGRGQKKLNAF